MPLRNPYICVLGKLLWMIGNQIAYEQKRVASVDLVWSRGCTSSVFTKCLLLWHVWLLQLLSLLCYINIIWKFLSCRIASLWRSLLEHHLSNYKHTTGNIVKWSTGSQECACLEKSLSKASLGETSETGGLNYGGFGVAQPWSGAWHLSSSLPSYMQYDLQQISSTPLAFHV